MKLFRFIILLITSILQAVLLTINFFIFPANKKFTFVNNYLFRIFMIACAFFSILILIKLISHAFFYFFDEDEDNSVQVMENCICESFFILLIYNCICLILHFQYPAKYEELILGYSTTGEGALNYIFLGIVAIIQSVYCNISYIIKLKVQLLVREILLRQIIISLLMILPYIKNFLSYFGRL